MPYASRSDDLAYHKKYYQEHKDVIVAQVGIAAKRNRTHRREYEKSRYERIKLEVISHYGGVCACCGESEIAFLQIDHIENNGAQHRREIEEKYHGRVPITLWLKRNDYPEGFQVLCANCNTAKQTVGICPHQINKIHGDL